MWLYRDVKREEGRWSLARTLGMSLFLMPVVACSGGSGGGGANTGGGDNKASNVAPQLASESSLSARIGSSFMRVVFKENVEAAESLRSEFRVPEGSTEKVENSVYSLLKETSSGKVVGESYTLAPMFENDSSRPTLTVTKKGKEGAKDEDFIVSYVTLVNIYKYDSSGNYDASSSFSYLDFFAKGRTSSPSDFPDLFSQDETYTLTIHDGLLTNRGRDIKNEAIAVNFKPIAFAELVSVTYHKTTAGKEGTVEVVFSKHLEKISSLVLVVPGQEKNYNTEITVTKGDEAPTTYKFGYGGYSILNSLADVNKIIATEHVLVLEKNVTFSKETVRFREKDVEGTRITFTIKDELPDSIRFSAGEGSFVSGSDFKWTVVSDSASSGKVKAGETYKDPTASHEDDLVGLSFLDVVDF